MTPNGNVVCVPYTAANVVVFSPSTSTWSNIQVGRGAGGGFAGGVLLPNGQVACAPFTNSNIGLVNPATLTFSNIIPNRGGTTSNAWAGACLSVDGRAVLVPCNATNVAVLNTTTPVPSTEFRVAPYFNKF